MSCHAAQGPNGNCQPYQQEEPQHDIPVHKGHPVKQCPQTPEYEHTADY
jgi:hypothetical protein